MIVIVKIQLRKVTKMKACLEDGNSEGTRRDPSKGHGVKKMNLYMIYLIIMFVKP
jgi:hypothetical protein